MRRAYLILAVLGAVVPYALFGPLILQGAGVGVWMEQLLGAPAARGLTGDITVSALVFLVWSRVEARRLGMRRWWPYPLVMVTVGLSCAFPLFLWSREGRASGAGSHQLPMST
jgi:hypothetical protein